MSAGDWVAVGLLYRNGLLGDDVRLVHRCLDDLLLVGIQVLGKIVIERRLFLLQSCTTSQQRERELFQSESYLKALL